MKHGPKSVDADFRSVVYERYASAFKECQGLDDSRAQREYAKWAERKIIPLLRDVPRTGRVLELGCGSGPMLGVLAAAGFRQLEGVDVAPEMVMRARQRGFHVESCDVFEFFARDEGHVVYDLIVALDFLEHFTKDELFRLLPQVAERLRPGGTLLVQTPNGAGLLPERVVHGDLTHVTVLTPTSLEQLLTLTGFVDCHFAETGPVPKSVVGAARVAIWSTLRLIATAIKAVETGTIQTIWTENMLCVARRPTC